MTSLITLAHQYPFVLMVFTVAAYWIFSAFVAGMPEPEATSGIGYIWAYKSLHILAANVKQAADKYVATHSFTVPSPPQPAPGQTTASTTVVRQSVTAAAPTSEPTDATDGK